MVAKKIYGVGYIGKGTYKSKVDGKRTPQYAIWYAMLKRSYDARFHEESPAYKGCAVAEDWHNFQNFAKWYDENYYTVDGEKMQLDKDILSKGNKVYSPDTCIFVPNSINMLFVKQKQIRGELPIGVRPHQGKFLARMSTPKGTKYIGVADTVEDAHNLYKGAKERYIQEVALEYKDVIPLDLYLAMALYEVDIDD
ncbi:HNH endonuclease [Bacillus phage BC-VP]|nr:HNH endonuclease [Bacillus phage BC-VP]